MNRLIASRLAVAADIYKLKFSKKFFSTDAVAKTTPGSSHAALTSGQERKEKLSSDIQQYDVAIVGGGMVGMALACSLGREHLITVLTASMPMTKHLRVAIIDSNPTLTGNFSFNKEAPPDPRVSTVTPSTISFFKDVGAWKYVEENRHAYFDKMQVWDYTGLGYTRYNAKDINKEVLGCVVENKILHGSLFSCIQNTDFQKTIYASRLTSMALNPSLASAFHPENLAKLELSDGNSLYAKLVVGADGGKSYVRELAGLKTTGWNYSQNAIICTVKHTTENHCACQRFLPAGPIALLPIGDSYSNIVWTMNPEESASRKSMNDGDFVKEVNCALDYGYGPHPKSGLFGNEDMFSWLGVRASLSTKERFELPPKLIELASERMVFPLSLLHANNYSAKRVALIGDAAHTVHPLAGQGVNLGFGDACALARVIAEGIAVGTDIGQVQLLKKYEAERKLANVAMMAILDGFQKAYSVDFGPLNILRAAAFHGAQYVAPLKRIIISYASGEQRLPLFS